MTLNKKSDLRVLSPRWKENPNKTIDKDAVVLDNKKPVIQVINFDGSFAIKTLEELWAMRSDIVVGTYGDFTAIGAEVFRLRAAYGAEIIREALRAAGYRNQGQSVNNKNTTLVFTPIPLKGKSATAESHKQMLPSISFFNEDQKAGWKLSIEGKATAPLDKALWDDDKGILRLVEYALDKEYCLTAFALTDPTKALKIKSDKDKYKNEVIVYDFFKPYKVGGKKLTDAYVAYRETVTSKFNEIFQETLKTTRSYYCDVPYNLAPEGPKNPSTFSSLLPISLSFERAVIAVSRNRSTNYDRQVRDLVPTLGARNVESFQKTEQDAFDQLVSIAKALSFPLLEAERTNTNGKKRNTFVKDDDIFAFFLANNEAKNTETLLAAVLKRQAESTKATK